MQQASEIELDQVILEGRSLCRGVLQRYLSYLQGQDLFPVVEESGMVELTDNNNQKHNLKLDLVDHDYIFDINKYNITGIRKLIEKIMCHMRMVFLYILSEELKPEDVPNPDLFMDATIQITPHTTFFLYSQKWGRKIHDDYPTKIGFVWC